MSADLGSGEVERAAEKIRSLAPRAAPVKFREPLQADESRWFLESVESGLIAFRECAEDCPRRRKFKVSGRDEFVNSQGRHRHLFSDPTAPAAWLNREYVPHIAAFGRAVIELGYDPATAMFSAYRTFTRDLITKKTGVSYETDVEFYDGNELLLHAEAKTKPREVEKIAAQLDRAETLEELPLDVAKEVEYVLELSPRFLWVVGPGSVDPAKHVFQVNVSGLTAQFTRVLSVPSPERASQEGGN